MNDVVAALLHKNVAPPSPAAVSTELPQSLITDIVGADGIALGAAVTLAEDGLVHPFTVCITV